MENYLSADKKIHVLSQTLAKAGRTWIQPKEDDSHTNLIFDPLDMRILSRWMDTSHGHIALTLNLTKRSFEWFSQSREVLHSIDFSGKSIKDFESELCESPFNLDFSTFRNEMHYAIPNYEWDANEYSQLNDVEIKDWSTWRRMANIVCAELLIMLQADAEIRVWPHHFDTGFFTSISKELSIGFGWAMKDSLAQSPYFYLTGYPVKGQIDFSKMDALHSGLWVSGEGWNGAILPLKAFETLSFDEMQAPIIGFLKGSIHAIIRSL